MTQSLPTDVVTAPWLRVRNRTSPKQPLDLLQLSAIATDIDNLFTFCVLLETGPPPPGGPISLAAFRAERSHADPTMFTRQTVQVARRDARRLYRVQRISYNSPLEFLFSYGSEISTAVLASYLTVSGRLVSLFSEVEDLRLKHSATSLAVERNKLLRQELRLSRREQQKAGKLAKKMPPPPRVSSTNKATLVDVGSMLESAGNALDRARAIDLVDPEPPQQP